MKKIFTNLTTWVLIAITAGALLGHFAPATAIKMEILGKLFIKVITWFIGPIIFLTISLGISGMGNLKKVGRVGGKALLYFEIVTTLALIIGIAVSYIIQPGSGVDTAAVKGGDISKYTRAATAFSWFNFLKENFTIQVLLLSIAAGIFLSRYNGAGKITSVLAIISKYIFKLLHFVMLLAPIGAFGGMAFTIGKYGIDTLLPLAKLMLTVYITAALFVFVILGAITALL